MAASGIFDSNVSPRWSDRKLQLPWEEGEEALGAGGEQSPLLDAFARLTPCTGCTSPRKPRAAAPPELPVIKGGGAAEERIRFEGHFERRGLRRWDVLWNSSFAELRGRVLTVYDVDDFEGDRTLVGHAVLSDELKVVRLSETEWQVRPCLENSACCDLQFQWRSADARCASAWVQYLQKACLPKEPIVVAKQPTKDAEGEVARVGAVILQSLLSPAFLGFSVFDPAAVMAIASMWSHVADMVNGAVSASYTSELKEATATLEHGPRPFQLAAPIVKACLLNADDVDLNKFLELLSFFPGVLLHMGSWMVPLAREGYKNSAMIRSRLDPAKPEASMRAMLKGEVDAGMHRPEGALADPSGAVAVLWAYRGLDMWAAMLRRCAVPSSWEGAPPANLMKASFEYAYETAIKQFHGTMMRSAVALGTSLIPRWEDVSWKYGPSPEDVQQDVEQWLEAMGELLPRIDAMIRELDLFDSRKTF